MIHKTTRSILSVLLAALLLVTSTPLTPAFADGGGVSLQSESAEGRELDGDGTKEIPYQIATANDLREFADKVNNQNKASAWAILTADIDLSGICSEESGTSWTPIGNSINQYSGTFDGDGYTISGLYINSDDNDQGLFGYVGTRGTVQNLTVSGSVKGDDYVGGVVGQNNGSVENCYNTGAVNSSGNRVGGVVGYNSSIGNIKNCYNTGAVNSSGNWVGGVVGVNSGSVTNCYNTGAVSGSDWYVGGVVGWNDSGANVENCYNTGKVSGNSYVGGVAGGNSSIGTVTGCYFLQTDGVPANGIGNGSGSATPLSAEAFESQVSFTSWDFDNTWKIESIFGRPTLQDNAEIGGTANNPYKIFTATQLETFRDIVNGANNQTVDPDAHAKLMNDIDLSSVCGPMLDDGTSWEPIGTSFSNSYSGNFDGDGHTISGLYINSGSDSYQGLFGRVNGGTVQDLSVSGSVSGNWYVGGVVGYNYSGTVTGCIFSGSGSVTGVTGSKYVGGVVGQNFGGTVKNCYNTGSVSGSYYVGGVVGWNDGSVTNCYFLQTDTVNVNLPDIGKNDGSGDATGKNDTAFHSGEVAYLLGEAWGQSALGTKDSWPTLVALDKANARKVYQLTFKYGYEDAPADEISYTNGSVKFPAFERTGHTLTGWQNEDGQAVTEPITITADTEFTAKWTPHTYSITASPSALDFGSITEGEERPAAQTVTVKNTGNQTVTLNQPTATNFEIAKIDDLALDAGESVKLTIQPKDKLPRGSYSEQIVVSNTNGEKAAITATFTVKEPPYTGKYSYEVFTSVGDNGTLSVDRYATEGEKVTIDVTPDQAYKLDELVVTANGKDVELTANSDGTYTFTMPSADVKITATFAEDPDWTPDEPEEPTTDVSDIFLDIAPNAWYKDAIQYAYDNGLMTGVSATEFAPEATTTRAMIVSILARLENVTTAEAAGFNDVNDEWYATAVNWAANVGVVNGYEDNTFRPNTAITREQLAAILMNYAAYKGEDVSNRASLTSYTDQPSTWAQEAISWSVAEGLLTGVTADTLQPQGAATRAQVAAILQRFLSE